MPQILRPAVTAVAAAAMLTGAPVVPFAAAKAEARDWRGDRHWGRHRHRDRVDAGDIIAGAIVLGGIAAIASGISKSAKEKRERDWDRDNAYDGGRGYDDRTDAVDVCARAAEDEASRDAPRAIVRTIDSVSSNGARYRVKGTVEVERPRGWDRDKAGTYIDRVRFSCTARNGSVLAFALEDNYAARW